MQVDTIVWMRKRALHSKVRSGCFTCKARRVKCGEERPICHKCLKSGYTCRGYGQPPAQVDTVVSGVTEASLLHVIPTNYKTEEEARSLASFIYRTSPMLSLFSGGNEFWSVILPQASWQYAEVHHMLMAVSLFDQYLQGTSSTLVVEGTYKSAIQHYNKACAGLAKGTPNVHNVLLSSIFGWLWEIIHNNFDIAEMHYSSARRILQTYKRAGLNKSITAADHDIVIEAIEKTEWDLHYQEFKAAQVMNLDMGDLPKIETLAEARDSLEEIVQGVSKIKVMDKDSDQAEITINQAQMKIGCWRLAYDKYKFTGPETLGEKRPIFLLHNIVLVFLELQRQQQEENIDSQSPLWSARLKQWDCVLNDTEKLMEYPKLFEIKKGLGMVLDCIIDSSEPTLGYHTRAMRLRERLD